VPTRCWARPGSGGKKTGKNPTDRGKSGTKKSLLTEGEGGPLGVVNAGANVVEQKLLRETIEAIVVERPDPQEVEQNLSLDKAYDNPRSREAAVGGGYVPHIRRIGEEKIDAKTGKKTHPARRWVVERTIGWLNRCRGILIRYEKKAENYLAVVQLACALLWFRRLHRLTT
jgi:putative transposase